MSFLLYLVAKYPEVQKKLHDEVFSVIGQNGKVDGESLQALPYLKACFKETVRYVQVISYVTQILYSTYVSRTDDMYHKGTTTW